MNNKFEHIIDRTEVPTLKFDHATMHRLFGVDKLWPSWVADMDFKAAPAIMDALQQRLNHGVFGYEVGRAEIAHAVTQWYQSRHSWKFDARHILFTPRTLNSLATLVCLFSAEGDGVIVQPPVFYDFKLIVNANKRKLVKNPLVLLEGRYTMDFTDLEKLASDPDNKLLILCNPHNPIGRVWHRDELQKLADICIEHGVFIIADEIHGDITYNQAYTPIASLSATANHHTATCLSPIKSFNLAGVGNSMIVIADDDKRAVCADWYNRMDINKNNVFTNAAIFLSSDARMAVNPGHWFGREGAGFARVNIACPRPVLQAALQQLEVAVNNLTKNS